jgi:hypothetical protein
MEQKMTIDELFDELEEDICNLDFSEKPNYEKYRNIIK